MNDDLNDAVKRDLQQVRQIRQGGVDSSIPAMLELVFATLTAIVVLAWVVSMFFWVPEPIAGGVWLGFGMLGMGLFGVPLFAIFMLRRGGADVIRAFVRAQMR